MSEAPAIAVGPLFERTGLKASDMTAIYDHNPFAVTDVIFAKVFDCDWKNMNNTGCPMIYGHPQGPTLMRATIEAFEHAVSKGGGYVLAAVHTIMAEVPPENIMAMLQAAQAHR